MFKGENMEEYKKALISVKNSLIIMNNKEKEKLKELTNESSLYQNAYEKSVNYKLFQKDRITNNFKDLIIYLIFKKRIEKEISETALGYALTIYEIENKIKIRNEEIEKLDSSIELLKDEQFVKKLKMRNNLKSE